MSGTDPGTRALTGMVLFGILMVAFVVVATFPPELLKGSISVQSVHSSNTTSGALSNALSDAPTDASTNAPSPSPTNPPTFAPSNTTSGALSNALSDAPTDVSTNAPSHSPTNPPTFAPSNTASGALRSIRSDTPTDVSTHAPSHSPIDTPTFAPSKSNTASDALSNTPSDAPSSVSTNAQHRLVDQRAEPITASTIMQKIESMPAILRKRSKYSRNWYFKWDFKYYRQGSGDMHNTSYALRKMRPGHSMTWQDIEASVTRAGHPYCALVRDNWSCKGHRYEKRLERTALYNRSLSLSAFPPGSRIFASGNSFFAQKIQTLICNSKCHVWADIRTNDVVAYDDESGVLLTLFDNDPTLNGDVPFTQWVVEWFMGNPTLVVLGDFNARDWPGWGHSFPHGWAKQMAPEARMSEWVRAFPGAVVMSYGGRRLPNNCRAEFTDCDPDNRVGHTCIPGPVNRYAEALVAEALTKLTTQANTTAHKR